MHKSERKPSAGKAIAEELFQFVVWVSEKIEKFPRSHKFTIGDRIQSGCLDLMELVVEAIYTKDRAHLLRRAQLRVKQLRFLYRLCFDLRLVTEKPSALAAPTF